MARRVAVDDDWEDDWDDDSSSINEEDGESWKSSADDDGDTTPCPYCRTLIYDDAVSCPNCKNYISEEDMPSQRKPWWIIIGLLAAFYVAYRWVVAG